MNFLTFLDSHLIPHFSFPRTHGFAATLERVAVPSDPQAIPCFGGTQLTVGPRDIWFDVPWLQGTSCSKFFCPWQTENKAEW